MSFNLEEAQVCAVLSSMVYDTKQGQSPSWDQLNRILREKADRYPPISHILKNLQVRQDESSFDMACFSSPNTIYIAVRGTDFADNVRDWLNNWEIAVFDLAVTRSARCVSIALNWKNHHKGKRVVCAGHSLGGTVAIALSRFGVGDFTHVFNYGRGLPNVTDRVFAAIFEINPDHALHHHIFGDLISPRYTAKVRTITYKQNCKSGNPATAHSLDNFTDAVARGGWPHV